MVFVVINYIDYDSFLLNSQNSTMCKDANEAGCRQTFNLKRHSGRLRMDDTKFNHNYKLGYPEAHLELVLALNNALFVDVDAW